jgi:hypothetical protein
MNFRFSGRKACPYRAVSWEILMTGGKAMAEIKARGDGMIVGIGH